ncbi:hypothetical protein WAI453_007452 [Rhynchosporium graminicola]
MVSPYRSLNGTSLVTLLPISCLFLSYALAILNATESTTQLTLSNSRLTATVKKAGGYISILTLDGQDLIGPNVDFAGAGPYLDCYCTPPSKDTPAGFYIPGYIAPKYQLIKGVDSTNTPYGGIVMSDVYPPTGQIMEQYWFLRENETGLHTFSRLAYYNKTTPFLRNVQELRVLFRPNTPLWTHLITNEKTHAPLPSKDAFSKKVVAQDATWYLGNTPEDPYVQQMADYFTKYTFQDAWRDHDVHGVYSDGSTSKDGSTFGSWLVMNTKDTYFGGPIHSDLTVDGIVYNYLVSNHHGEGTPNITDGFDRTFGPQYYHFNKGPSGTSMETLRQEAVKFASPTWNAAFYDSIAPHVPNYVPSSSRSTWKAHVDLPLNAKKPLAVLSQNGVYFQDNSLDTKAYQYWAEIDPATGNVEIPSVKAGTYRMTLYAEGVFGQYVKDDIEVITGEVHTTHARWREETAGKELWRIGTPDLSAGEFKHGYARTNKPLTPEQYRIYWATYDFPTEFPTGVTYTIGESDSATDFNYVHWSVFGGYGNYLRKEQVWENINNWTLLWDMQKEDFERKREATFTVQLAAAKTAAGNTDIYKADETFANLPYTVVVNGHQLEPWVIPYYHSSSCAVRSAVSCYNLAKKFTFDPKFFVEGKNEIILSLPANATNRESAVLASSVYVQYDALRLEVM